MFGSRGGFGSSNSQHDSYQTFDVYVARIPADLKEAELKEMFSPIGEIKGVKIQPGKGDYTSNFGFVKFTTEEDAMMAVKYLNHAEVKDGNLLVSYRKKEGQGSSDSGGFGSGGFQRQASNEKSATRGAFTANRGRGSSRGGRGGMAKNNQGFSQENKLMTNGFPNSQDAWDNDMQSPQTSSVPTSPKAKMETEQVLGIDVCHPTKFWGQPIAKDVLDALETITAELQTQCPNLPPLTDQIPYGKVFGCIFSVDGVWYRCKVEKQIPEPEAKVLVRYIDYGNFEIVDLGKLVVLPPSLSQQPACAKEFDLNLKPCFIDESSIKYKQAVDFLKNMVEEKVVRYNTTPGLNPNVEAYVDKTDEDIRKAIVARGYATFPEQSKANEERPSFNKANTAAQAIRPPRGANSFQVSRENQELKNKIDSLEAEVQSMKQDKSRLENALKENESKCLKPMMTERFDRLSGEVAALKKLRGDMDLDEAWNPLLKTAVDLMSNKENSINLENMTVYQELLKGEEEMKEHQLEVKNCSEKEALGELVEKRDESRRSLLQKMDAFLEYSNKLPFETRQKELEFVLSEIKKKYILPSNIPETSTVSEAMQDYEDWRSKKIESVKQLQSVADDCSSSLTNCLDGIKEKVNLNYQPMLIDIDVTTTESSCEDIDKFIDAYSQAIASEVTQIKESNIRVEAKQMAMNLVNAVVSAINSELTDIKKLRNELLENYQTKKEDVSCWLHKLPDVSKLKRTRNSLKGLKSKFRHKQADRRDFEEDPDEKEQLAQTEKELEFIRNELHAVFVEEHKLLKELSCIVTTHFPELPVQHADLGISLFLETNGLVRARELEHYDHHALPLLSSSTKQPVIFKTKFNDQPCVLKEYSLNDRRTKDQLKASMTNYAKCNHENLTSLDGLFFDKGGRKAYLQTKFYNLGDLFHFIKSKPDTKVLQRLLHGILKGIACLHSNNLVHGSISPKDVFVHEEDGKIAAVLEEPNFAKDQAERIRHIASFTSSNNYPSISADSELPSPSFDVYCFGLLMLWAYFPDATYSGNVQSILSSIVKDNPVGDLLDCLLNKVPSLRITAEDALSHAFFEKAKDRSQSPSEELLNTIKDPNESFVNIEEESCNTDKTLEPAIEEAIPREGDAEISKGSFALDNSLVEITKEEVNKLDPALVKLPDDDEVSEQKPADAQSEDLETFSDEWKQQ